MIKNRNLKVGQSEEISNLFVRSRKEFKHKQKQVPKELEWLLMMGGSKTTSLLLGVKPKHKKQHSLFNKDPSIKEDIIYTQTQRQREKEKEKETIMKDNFSEYRGLLTDISNNAPKKRDGRTPHLLKNEYIETEYYNKNKRSFSQLSQLKPREQILNIELQNKTFLRRPFTGIRHRVSVNNSKEARVVQMEDNFMSAFRTTKINESSIATRQTEVQEGSSNHEGKQSSKNKNHRSICTSSFSHSAHRKAKSRNQSVSKKENIVEEKDKEDVAIKDRKPWARKHIKHQSLFQHLDLKPWQNKDFQSWDDFNIY